MAEVEPVFSLNAFSSLQECWDSLLARSFQPTFQYELEWVLAWLRYLQKDWKPLLLTVKEDNKLIGIFPLMYRDEKRRGLFPQRRVKFLCADDTDFSAILADAGDMGKVVDASFRWLFSKEFRWELMILDDLVEGNPAVQHIEAWLKKNSDSMNYVQEVGKYYFIDLTKPWEQIMREASRDFVRRNVNLAHNRISREGEWKVIVDPDWDAEAILLEASQIHIERQAELGRDSLFSDKMSKEYVHSIIQKSKLSGIFRSYWLCFDKTAIAYQLGFEIDGVFFGWNMAHLPKYARFYPSRLLLFSVVRDCYDRQLKEFNFMRGESEYKAKWTKQSRGNYRFIIRNTSHLYGKLICSFDRIRSGCGP